MTGAGMMIGIVGGRLAAHYILNYSELKTERRDRN